MKVGVKSIMTALENNFDSEEKFEIFNLKNAKNRLSSNASDLWQHSYV